MSEKQKRLYEQLDAIAADLIETDFPTAGEKDGLAELIFTLTGSDTEGRLDPDARDAARGTCLRWLCDHGYLRRTPRGYASPR